ncbi:polyamine deacetylase HDAC10-like [Babylonia areolata]|uniref:polyamine deacetylase HDAC10-like n=1 Tax=Babylonia areolata TaxID=304850 RepID=UPI003FD5467E
MEGHGRDQTVCEAASLATGLVYDEKLSRHYCAWNPAYTERPERIKECYARIQQLGLLERCVNIPVRPATNEEIELCHTRKHMDLLKETQYMTIEQLGTLSRSYDFVYFHKTVEENARLALGGAIDLVDHVVSGKLQNGMAVVRPPGHHAMSQQFCGYCYFNNIAVAARTALKKHGLKRILIVDWDVHHGQGTQFDFYNDPRVLFFSIHRYEHGMEWPYLRESDYDYVGEGEARGFNINVPLNEIGCDNSDYLSVFFNILLPVAYEFEPELVLVSAGYDSAIGCPEGQMSVTPACFAHFVKLLKPLAAGKLVLLLEGGFRATDKGHFQGGYRTMDKGQIDKGAMNMTCFKMDIELWTKDKLKGAVNMTCFKMDIELWTKDKLKGAVNMTCFKMDIELWTKDKLKGAVNMTCFKMDIELWTKDKLKGAEL